MGNKSTKKGKNNINRYNTETNIKVKGKHIKGSTKCPLCFKTFDSNNTIKQLNDHLIICGKNFMSENPECEIYSPADDPILNNLIFKFSKEYKISTIKQKSTIDLNAKIEELKKSINSRKISWQDGFCQIEVQRNNILNSSMEKIEKVDLFKELKINFAGELCYDAGGIFREWFTILFK